MYVQLWCIAVHNTPSHSCFHWGVKNRQTSWHIFQACTLSVADTVVSMWKNPICKHFFLVFSPFKHFSINPSIVYFFGWNVYLNKSGSEMTYIGCRPVAMLLNSQRNVGKYGHSPRGIEGLDLNPSPILSLCVLPSPKGAYRALHTGTAVDRTPPFIWNSHSSSMHGNPTWY